MPDLAATYNIFLIIMTVIAVIVFISLFFVDAGYGMFKTKKWGPAIPNRLGWVLMESPVFILMSVPFILLNDWYSERLRKREQTGGMV